MLVYEIATHLFWLYDWHPNIAAFCIAALAAIVAVYGMLLTLDTWKESIWVPQMFIIVLALALSCFSLRETVQGAMGFMLAAVFCSHVLYWIAFPAILAESNAPKGFLAAVLLILVNEPLSGLAGDAIGSLLPHSLQNLGGVAGLSVIALVAVLWVTHVIVSRISVGDDGSEADIQLKADPLETRVAELSNACGFTPRESEVALYTARGYSIAYIADKLVVSHSTVRFHQQNLYRKADVHSRNEFIELVSKDSGNS